jgi:hypothetical protein
LEVRTEREVSYFSRAKRVSLYTTTKWTLPLRVRQYFNSAWSGPVRCLRALALFVESFEDPRGPLARNMGISLIARVADGVSLTQLTQMMEARSEALDLAAGARNVLIASPAPLRAARVIAEQRRLLFVLLGAAISLLLTACANVASLELASALTRAEPMQSS